jgi:hypothetical protein
MTASAAPTPEAAAAAADMRLEAIVETMELVASYATAGREAAWRGDASELGVHIRQLRECIGMIVEVFNQMETVR